MPTPDPTHEYFDDTEMSETVRASRAAARALAEVTAVSFTPAEHAGYVLLRGVTSPAGTEQWQAVSGIHQERHLGYLQRLRTEQQEGHPEEFWRFEIATVTIPGVPS